MRKVARVGVDSISPNYKNLDEAAEYLHIPKEELRTLLKEKKIRVLLIWERKRTKWGVETLRKYRAVGRDKERDSSQ